MLFKNWVGDLDFCFRVDGCLIRFAILLAAKVFALLGVTPFTGLLCVLGVQASTISLLFTMLGGIAFVELACAMYVKAADAVNSVK